MLAESKEKVSLGLSYRGTRLEAEPNQVRDRGELEVGGTYVVVHTHLNRSEEPIKVISEPFQDKEGKWWIYTETGRENPFLYKRSLADLGIEPYKVRDGMIEWNKWNLLLKHKIGSPRQNTRKAIRTLGHREMLHK